MLGFALLLLPGMRTPLVAKRDGVVVARFESTAEAARHMGVAYRSMIRLVVDHRKLHGLVFERYMGTECPDVSSPESGHESSSESSPSHDADPGTTGDPSWHASGDPGTTGDPSWHASGDPGPSRKRARRSGSMEDPGSGYPGSGYPGSGYPGSEDPGSESGADPGDDGPGDDGPGDDGPGDDDPGDDPGDDAPGPARKRARRTDSISTDVAAHVLAGWVARGSAPPQPSPLPAPHPTPPPAPEPTPPGVVDILVTTLSVVVERCALHQQAMSDMARVIHEQRVALAGIGTVVTAMSTTIGVTAARLDAAMRAAGPPPRGFPIPFMFRG